MRRNKMSWKPFAFALLFFVGFFAVRCTDGGDDIAHDSKRPPTYLYALPSPEAVQPSIPGARQLGANTAMLLSLAVSAAREQANQPMEYISYMGEILRYVPLENSPAGTEQWKLDAAIQEGDSFVPWLTMQVSPDFKERYESYSFDNVYIPGSVNNALEAEFEALPLDLPYAENQPENLNENEIYERFTQSMEDDEFYDIEFAGTDSESGEDAPYYGESPEFFSFSLNLRNKQATDINPETGNLMGNQYKNAMFMDFSLDPDTLGRGQGRLFLNRHEVAQLQGTNDPYQTIVKFHYLPGESHRLLFVKQHLTPLQDPNTGTPIYDENEEQLYWVDWFQVNKFEHCPANGGQPYGQGRFDYFTSLDWLSIQGQESPRKETMYSQTRWDETGAGMARLFITGQDIATRGLCAVELRECWDETFQTTFYAQINHWKSKYENNDCSLIGDYPVEHYYDKEMVQTVEGGCCDMDDETNQGVTWCEEGGCEQNNCPIAFHNETTFITTETFDCPEPIDEPAVDGDEELGER